MALAEFGNCRSCKGTYIIDCYVAPKLGSKVARVLLTRRLKGGVKLVPSPPIDAPMLAHHKCSIGDFMNDVTELWEILNDKELALKHLEEEIPEEYFQPIIPKNVLYFPFRTPKINVVEAVLKTNVSILKDIMKSLCLNEGIPPTKWTQGYVLVSFNQEKKIASIHEGKHVARSIALETFIYKRGLITEILKEVDLWSKLHRQ